MKDKSRWQTFEDARNASRRTLALKRSAVLLAIAAISVVAVVKFVLPRYGYEMSNLLGASCTGFDNPNVANYADIVALFKNGRAAMWRDAPREIKPKSAVAGTVYHALVLDSNNAYDIYEMSANGDGSVSVRLMSPFVSPRPSSMTEFKGNSAGKRYFVEHAGVVYACGGLDASTVEGLRSL